MSDKEKIYHKQKTNLRNLINKFDLEDDLIALFEAEKLIELLLDKNEFPRERLSKYKKNGGKI